MYWSNWAVWGALISFLTLIFAGCAFAAIFIDSKRAVFVSILFIAAGTGLGWTLYNSLYHGDNLNTNYHWSSDSFPAIPNRAYGKRAYFQSQGVGRWSLLSYGGLAVDGDYRPKTGFKSTFKMNPYWIVDLYDLHRIGSIILYEGYYGEEWNRRPLKIFISQDGKDWHQVVAIEEKMSGQPIKAEFSNTELARYLMIKATGLSRLSINEIEVLPSDG